MSRARFLFLLSVVGWATIAARTATIRPEFDMRMEAAQLVLYRVHRGGGETLHKAVRDLYTLAAEKKMEIKGPLTLVALNSPDQESAHVLTEIRIPVGETAWKHAHTLGEMTDVKQLRPRKVAFTKKAKGQSDPFDAYLGLHDGLRRMQLVPIFGLQEVFPAPYDPNNYDGMETEIMVALWEDILPDGK